MYDPHERIRVVIAQTHGNRLEEIEMALQGVEGIEAIFTFDPLEVIALASNPETKVIIIGQYFYAGGRSVDEMIAIPGGPFGEGWREVTRNALEMYGDLDNGNNLARAAREANPNLLTLRYSSTPKGNEGFCGDIDKLFTGTNAIVELLTNSLFQFTLKQVGGSNYHGDLPDVDGVHWHFDEFPKGWLKSVT